MKKFCSSFTLIMLAISSLGQFVENFNNGIPSNWTQFSGNGIIWRGNTSLGVSSSGCAISDYSISSVNGTSWLQTPFTDLSNINSPVLNFSVALIGNNFVAPDVSLWYDNGSGWVRLNSWGNNITQTFDRSLPLDSSNVSWVNLSYDLSALSSNNNIRFSFGSDYTNGGWVLIDDVVLQAGARPTIYKIPYLQDFENTSFPPKDWETFGANSRASWEHNTTIGGYGTSSSSMFFNNFGNNVGGSFYGIRSVMLDLTGTTNPILTFDIAYAQRNNSTSDRLGIWYSFNGTTGWNELINYESSDLSTAPFQNTYFTPTDSQWASKTINLSQFAGNSLIRFAFENNSNNGNVLYIDNVSFKEQDLSTKIFEHKVNKFEIYPNPSFGIISYENNLKEDIHLIQIFDLHGNKFDNIKLIKQNTNYLIDLSKLPKGMYLVSIIANSGDSFTKKILLK